MYYNQCLQRDNYLNVDLNITLTLLGSKSVKHITLNLLSLIGLQVISFLFLYSVSFVFEFLVIVPFLVFFLLKDKDVFISYLNTLLPEKKNLLSKIWKDVNLQLYGYLRGKGLEMIFVAMATGIVFYFQGVNYSIILAILVGLSVLIPYVGAILVTIPVIIIGFFQWGLDSNFYIFLTSYLIIQVLDGNVLMPLLLGREVKLHPVFIITAVLIFGGIWGFWGLLLAIPIATFLRTILLAWPARD